jgi:glycosyltransferase involved in cell wall biosynthesis
LENISELQKSAPSAPRLIVLTEFADTKQNSTGYYWAKIIGGLAKQFDLVYVICPLSSYQQVISPLPCVDYLPFRDLTFNKNSIVGRTLGQFLQALGFSWALIRNARESDLVFSGTNPAVSILCVAILKRILGFKWVLLVHDVFPENLVPAQIVREHSLAFRAARTAFNGAYAAADMLIAIGRDMRDALLAKTNNKVQVAYIPNWVDPNDIAAAARETNDLLRATCWAGKTVFQFFGNLGRVQGLEDLLAALPLVKAKNAGFLFIGCGAMQALVEKFVNEFPTLTVMWVPHLAFSENAKGLAACDVAIVSLVKGMKGLAVPSKAYFSLAADRPVLVVADEGSELHLLVRDGRRLGWFCQSGNPIALARLIDEICTLDLAEFHGAPRLAMTEQYTYQRAMEDYANCIRALGFESSSH